jgi:Pvc16 N-terminal domain
MSSPLAIAAVTNVLKNFLENSIAEVAAALGGSVNVSTEPPDRLGITSGPPDRINLFLFQATENTGWRNSDLPARNRNGDRISNPYLALDLSYLLTAYSSAPLHAEALLGYAMFVFHEMPVLTRDAIRAMSLTPADPALLAALQSSELADQLEQIRIAPQTMSVEELSKIWSALLTQYRPTAVYKASVVLIESEKSVKPTLPVRARNILVSPFARPSIDLLQSQAKDGDPIVADQPILARYNLVIDGQQLRGETTLVLVDETEIMPDDAKITATRITVPLPGDLQPGLHSVQVVQPVDFGTSSEPHRGVESNVAAFLLSPQITTATPISAARNTMLTLAVNPPVGRAQRVALLVGSSTIPISARDAAGPETTSDLDFPIPAAFPTGSQLLRVQVGGAESPLAVDASGNYIDPKIEIT